MVLNSAINPLAYAFFERDIEKEFKRLTLTLILVGCRSYMNVCESLELRLINLYRSDSKRIQANLNLEKWHIGEKTRTFGP